MGKRRPSAPRRRRSSKPARRRAPASGRARPPRAELPAGEAEVSAVAEDRAAHHETGPVLTGGDVDADWLTAHSVGEEAVGGSVATPDQDIVDELGEALGVPQEPDAEVRTSTEILAERDAVRWRIEREVAREEERG
jgi:hypothetical protein